MSLNKYQEHILVVPEDEANEKIAHGFTLFHEIADRKINVLPIVGGWSKVLSDIKKVHLHELQKYPKRVMVLLIDFDNQYDDRFLRFTEAIPTDLKDRVFVLGVLEEPETLNSKLEHIGFESIGRKLAKDCYEPTEYSLWNDPLLKHNISEVERMQKMIRPWMFRQ